MRTNPPYHFRFKLRWSILTLFLLAMSMCCLTIIFVTYRSNYKEILDLSISRMKNMGHEVASTIDAGTNEAKLTANLIDGLIKNEASISGNNPSLISYLIYVVETLPIIESITIGSKGGNLIAVTDLTEAERTGEAPSDAQYKILFLEQSGGSPVEFVEYRDQDNNLMEKKAVTNIAVDPRTQPWYQVTTQWPHIHWTSDYSSFTDSIIANLSTPIFNSSREIIAVLNIGISLEELSNITSYARLGKSGITYILNEAGEIVIPLVPKSGPHLALLELANSHFVETQESTFRLEKEGVPWLVNCSLLPLDYETKWLIITLVPFHDFFASIVRTQNQTIIISVCILVGFAILGFFLSSHYISTPITRLSEQSDRLQKLDFGNYTPIHSHISEISTLASSSHGMRNALTSFVRYIPREVIKMLIEQKKKIALGGQRGELTILFTDIENFTTVSEMLPIEALLSSLSEYFAIFSKIIVDGEGTIDKYIGDSIMALWNAPVPVVDSSSKACLAALKCLKTAKNRKTDNPFLLGRTRFGIHVGEVIFGNIGTSERMCYTAIGSAVNTAQRLENLNKQYQTCILISESVHERLGPEFVTRPLDFVYMKGREKGMTVYELVGLISGSAELVATPEEIALCRDFNLAYREFHEGKIEEAFKNFEALHQNFPSDFSAKTYLDKTRTLLATRGSF